ncbi:hypothetical protein [Pedobacter sp. JCM 36344]|uniref:hypothetical protein n=1 Tax=Pedobacter sp. JCM 36344 TaxID=3374280 RepID=UPI0039793F36
MMNYRETLEYLRTHVRCLFRANKHKRFYYHNLEHTEHVVVNTVKIANHYQLSDQDFFIVLAASWYHDIGYLFSTTDHEAKGVELCFEFLKDKGIGGGLYVLHCQIIFVQATVRFSKEPTMPYVSIGFSF